jgi:hypothetical protein
MVVMVAAAAAAAVLVVVVVVVNKAIIRRHVGIIKTKRLCSKPKHVADYFEKYIAVFTGSMLVFCCHYTRYS